MEYGKTDRRHYEDIANAIRERAGTQDTYAPREMAAAIDAIPTGKAIREPYVEEIINENGELVDAILHGYTRIRDEAFVLSSMTRFDVPDGVRDIGDYAFCGCGSLREVRLPESLESIGRDAFVGCYNLEIIELPNGLRTVGNGAFNTCESIESLTLPDSIESIGDRAFAFGMNGWVTGGIAMAKLPASLKTIGAEAFYRVANATFSYIPNGVTSIGASAFYSASSITISEIPESVVSVGRSAFSECAGIETMNLVRVNVIDQYAFQKCANLRSVRIECADDEVGTDLWHYAFMGCNNLREVVIQNRPRSISNMLFYQCPNLTTIRVSWAEGEVNYAPWGAVNATVVYNYREEA